MKGHKGYYNYVRRYQCERFVGPLIFCAIRITLENKLLLKCQFIIDHLIAVDLLQPNLLIY
jgi:hypothetical protein